MLTYSTSAIAFAIAIAAVLMAADSIIQRLYHQQDPSADPPDHARDVAKLGSAPARGSATGTTDDAFKHVA